MGGRIRPRLALPNDINQFAFDERVVMRYATANNQAQYRQNSCQ